MLFQSVASTFPAPLSIARERVESTHFMITRHYTENMKISPHFTKISKRIQPLKGQIGVQKKELGGGGV